MSKYKIEALNDLNGKSNVLCIEFTEYNKAIRKYLKLIQLIGKNIGYGKIIKVKIYKLPRKL